MTAEELIAALRDRGLWFTETAPGCFEHHTGHWRIRVLVQEQAIGLYVGYGSGSTHWICPVSHLTLEQVTEFLAGRWRVY